MFDARLDGGPIVSVAGKGSGAPFSPKARLRIRRLFRRSDYLRAVLFASLGIVVRIAGCVPAGFSRLLPAAILSQALELFKLVLRGGRGRVPVSFDLGGRPVFPDHFPLLRRAAARATAREVKDRQRYARGPIILASRNMIHAQHVRRAFPERDIRQLINQGLIIRERQTVILNSRVKRNRPVIIFTGGKSVLLHTEALPLQFRDHLLALRRVKDE